jgi:drug/metabolite transporter (DMT)-like permease
MKPNPTAVLVGLGCVWGASFLFIKVLLDDISPLQLVTARLALGAAVVLAMLVVMRRPVRRDPSFFAKAAVLAIVANVIPFALIAWAELHIDSGEASVLNSTMPLFTALFAAFVLAEEESTMARVLGLVAGVGGVALLGGRDIVHITNANVLGQLAVVLGAACYGASAVYARTLLREDDPITLTGVQLCFGAMFALVLSLSIDGVPHYETMGVKSWLALLMLGLVASGIAQWVYLWLVDNMGSVRASLVTYVIPVVGLLLGWAALGEHLRPSVIGGFALIIAGVAAVMRGQAPTSQRDSAPPASEVIDVAPAD